MEKNQNTVSGTAPSLLALFIAVPFNSSALKLLPMLRAG
jgi:hypothetical protein